MTKAQEVLDICNEAEEFFDKKQLSWLKSKKFGRMGQSTSYVLDLVRFFAGNLVSATPGKITITSMGKGKFDIKATVNKSGRGSVDVLSVRNVPWKTILKEFGKIKFV